MPTTSPLPRLLVALATIGALLVGCGQTPPPIGGDPTPSAIRGSVMNADAGAAGLSLLLLRPGAFGGDELEEEPGTLEISESMFALVGLAPIADDGSFELPLADPPADFLAPIASAFLNLQSTECTLVVADDTVQSTVVVFEGPALPNVVALTFLGGVLSVALDTEETVDFDADPITWLEGRRVLSWLYVDGATTVVSDEATCSTPSIVFDIDLALEPGWNQLAFTYIRGTPSEEDPELPLPLDAHPSAITLRNAADATPYVTLTPERF